MNNMGQSEPDEATRHTQRQTGQRQIQAEAKAHTPGAYAPCGCGRPDDLTTTSIS